MIIKKRLALLLAAVMLITILPGCGGGSSGSKHKSDTHSAGLYEPGTKELIKSWDELIEEGAVMVINGEVLSGWNEHTEENSSSEKLYGDLVLNKEVTSISSYAFAKCTRLTGITIPDSVTSIGECAFCECSSLTTATLGDGLTSIGYRSFEKCTSLTSIEIPDSVIEIRNCAFYNCTSLISVTLPDSITEIGAWVFCNCSSLTDITIPDSVTTIGSLAFACCSSLTGLTIPDSVSLIGDEAFSDCTNWQSIRYDNGLYLGDENNPYLYLFDTVSNDITSCSIHPNTKFIDADTFHDCYYLTSIDVPDNVTSIGSRAFKECYSLTSVALPDSLLRLGGSVFFECTKLTSMTFSGTQAQWNAIIGVSDGMELSYRVPLDKVVCSDGSIYLD